MSTGIHSYYNQLIEQNKKLVILGSAQSIIHWDMETMMPPKAVELRSEQLALLSQLQHNMATSKERGKLLKEIQGNKEYEKLNDIEKRNMHLIKKDFEEQTKLPSELVKEIAKQQAITVNVWKKAKKRRNFQLLKPELKKLVDYNKKAAQILMDVKNTKTPYDALIDAFEPKMTAEIIDSVFSRLQDGIKKLLKKIESSNAKIEKLHVSVPSEKQHKIAVFLAQNLGYDVSSSEATGRIDETEHPFTTGYYDDVRITTHYYEHRFTNSIFSVLHETGHALYELGLPKEWKYQPVGTPCSMGFHESQSRFYENIIGRSIQFWKANFPKIKEIATPSLDDLRFENFISTINNVKPSKIRIESDEITYNLHIIIRFQIEKDLFADKITIEELPQIWNAKYKDTLGLSIQNDSEGVMQDTHWPSGLYGYFPSYTLGNIYSGQIATAIQKQTPKWQTEISQGNFQTVQTWLKQNIYNQGNLLDPEQLIKKATNNELNEEPYLNYLERKFSQIYGF